MVVVHRTRRVGVTQSGAGVIPPFKLGHSVRQRTRWRSGHTLVIVFCSAALVLTACGSDAPTRGVSLFPDAAANGKTWQWTPACPLGPATPTACAASGPNLGPAQLNGDVWNLGAVPAKDGSVQMSVARGALTVRGRLPSAPPCTDATCIAPSANTWVRGYPSALYGINQCSSSTSPPVSSGLPLPMRVNSIPSDLIGTTAYTSQTPHVTYDIAYDMWLNNSDTKTPCKKDGTVEVMVWTGYDQQALLPGSVRTATASVPFKVNGTLHPGAGAWSVYVSNVFTRGHTEPWGGTVWFILNRADTTNNGTVSVDLSTVLSEVATLLQNNYGWRSFRESYWLDTIPFGMEFGPESGTVAGAGSAYFSMRLSAYCLDVGSTLSEATCDRLGAG